MTLNFVLPRMMPGSPITALIARFHGQLSPAAIRNYEVAFGYHPSENVFAQYLDYLNNVVHLNFGPSLGPEFPASVSSIVLQALPWTLALAGITTVIAFVLGTLIGMLVAWRRGGLTDSTLTSSFVVLSTIPYFWVGLLAIYFFADLNSWLPSGFGYDITLNIGFSWTFIGSAIDHGILPAATIIITAIGGWILTMRNNMVGVLNEDYVRMARAKGLRSWRIMLLYAGRNAILPNLAGFAMSLGFVVSGLLLTEIVFNYPGVGYLFLQAVENQDYPLMQALFLLVTVAVLCAILVADVVNVILDPRTRSGE